MSYRGKTEQLKLLLADCHALELEFPGIKGTCDEILPPNILQAVLPGTVNLNDILSLTMFTIFCRKRMLKYPIPLKVDVKADGENGLYFLRPFLPFNL